MTTPYNEPLILVMHGGPNAGKRLSSSAMIMEFPDFIYDTENNGKYVLVRTNNLPPQEEYDLNVRCAEYHWEPDDD